jgi:hypothetical protein
MDEMLGLMGTLTLNGSRQRSLSDSGPNDKDLPPTNGEFFINLMLKNPEKPKKNGFLKVLCLFFSVLQIL